MTAVTPMTEGMTEGMTDWRLAVEAETEASRPFLVPELELRLITPSCRLWRATEADLKALGWPDPYWAFAWPGGQALARFLLDHPEQVRGKRVFDVGAGCGIEALAALQAGAASAVVNDIDPLSLAACEINAKANGLSVALSGEDWVGRPVETDVLLLGDVTYGEALTQRIMAWLGALAERGVEVLISDPGRGFLALEGLLELAVYEAPQDADMTGKVTVKTPVYRLRQAKS